MSDAPDPNVTRAEEGVKFPSEADFLRETIKVVEWQRDNARQERDEARDRLAAATATIARLKADNASLIAQVSDLARARGEAEGRLRASEAAGVVEGWQERALAAETEVAKQIVSARLTAWTDGYGGVEIMLAGGRRIAMALDAPHMAAEGGVT